MHATIGTQLSSAFRRLAWSNLAAQSAEQIALAAAPILAVVAFGVDAGETGVLQTAQAASRRSTSSPTAPGRSAPRSGRWSADSMAPRRVSWRRWPASSSRPPRSWCHRSSA